MEKVHVLIDSRFIRNYRNMEPVLGKAVKSDKNPLFRDEAIETGEKDCGFGVCYCSYPNVFRDPAREAVQVLLYRAAGDRGTA